MKKIIGAGIAAATLMAALPALAADLPQAYPTKAPPPVVAVPAFSWTGFYLGANGGYGWGSGGDGISELDPSGWLGGGQIGFNYQFGNNVVLGIEADMQASDFSDSYNGLAPSGLVSSKLDYFGTARARVGYAFDNVLPYVTGGFAWGHNEVTNLADGLSSDNTHMGWTVGGGVEYALTNNWTVKAEYLYMDLGKEYYDSIGTDADVTSNVARFGVNYKF